MTEENNVRALHPAQPEQVREHWKEVPRSEMYKTVITAVDAAKGEAVELGDESFVRLCDKQLFPFLYAELERAREAERVGQ